MVAQLSRSARIGAQLTSTSVFSVPVPPPNADPQLTPLDGASEIDENPRISDVINAVMLITSSIRTELIYCSPMNYLR
ncbi:hypothetical protein Mkiyose1665_50870 [Mycobacterium kiyosense]|uniref:Uncharacterized protein n=1 Tax=Mycobacterium kiyosense TaxID=2871094 RepID=A0A9P3Q936_9MYCO|nr:hypothetical protein IWGMT90018_12000 [Mycobacterium kiyosense]BDE12557.1 hypothetical protein MKCMC460_14170 [Mycobacterium sp. 20KCMC460]GLB85249.1 hypothetical protein SRL2020028_45050 [Mycobacterium kiyosense]GLB92209.1 hypothetical protein SRL2020130_50260 [Mycobacterium kiyosense]GLB98216.1 hypothetical protein SRL2020226_49920 [Mycobacterium kiyosense]